MEDLLQIPISRLERATLQALLEEFASRDGTDYGERETPLSERVASLHEGLVSGALCLLYAGESEQWDIVESEYANMVLSSDGDGHGA